MTTFRNELELIYFRKRIPDSKWWIVLTNKNHEFYFHVQTRETVWEIPDEIAAVIRRLVEQTIGIEHVEEYESEEEQEEARNDEDEKPEMEESVVEDNVEHIPKKQKLQVPIEEQRSSFMVRHLILERRNYYWTRNY